MKLIAYGFAVLLALLVVATATAWILTAPEGPPAKSESAARLAAGPYAVGKVERTFIDASRPTPASGGFAGVPERQLTTTIWFPKGVTGRRPLIIYAHGFYSNRFGGVHLAEHLASHGTIVIAPDFPLSRLGAPGRPAYEDVVNQPGDISFVIDRMLALNAGERPFKATVDADRIGLVGLSLGGLTVTLSAFHPEWRDHRIAAAISIAGPADILGPGFYDHASVPFLMIAATADATVNYELNALPFVDRARGAGLVTVSGGTHAGFQATTSGLFRVVGNPDAFLCRLISLFADPEEVSENVFVGLLGPEAYGLIAPPQYRPLCTVDFGPVMRAGRQQMIATLAVRAFFDSLFAPEPQARAAHENYLKKILPAEIPEVSYTPSRR